MFKKAPKSVMCVCAGMAWQGVREHQAARCSFLEEATQSFASPLALSLFKKRDREGTSDAASNVPYHNHPLPSQLTTVP